MNSDNRDDSDDEQFEAFLRGEDALSQRLRALPREEPSAKLDAAILTRAAQAAHGLPADARAPAANDPAPPQWRPMSSRWRVPAGLAAMLLAGVLTHRTWQETNQMEQVDAPAQEAVRPQAQPATSGVPADGAETAPAPAADEASGPATDRRARVEEQSVEVQMEAAPPPPASIPPAQVAAPAPAAPAPAPSARVESAVANTTEARSAPRAVTELARPAPAPAPVAAAPMPAPAPAAAPPSSATPEAWLGRIEELLAAGSTAEALAQWDAFRAAHPDHPVDPGLQQRISALRQR